jgi:hypothetical protein
MKLLSKILFYLSSFSILPPKRAEQERIIELIERKNADQDSFLRRSISQYDCQSFFFLKMFWYGFNVFSAIAIFPLFVILIVRSFVKVKKQNYDNISLYYRIPKILKDNFNALYIRKPFGYLKPRDYKYISKIFFKSGFRPYFVFRSVWKIAVYSEIMDTYSPKRIWVTQEMVFESSLLTYYLNDFSIEHNNFMHGDNYYSIQTTFAAFNEFYVWDEFYANLFKSLRCSAKEFHVFQAIDRLTSNFTERNVIKYYNQESSSLKNFNKILDNLVKFSQHNVCGLVVRLHPLHNKQYEVEALKSRNIEIEPGSIDTIDSLSEAKYVCSEFSSVLYQASLLNKTIVIDNTFPERIEIIKDLDVIFLVKLKHLYLCKN